MKLSLLRRHYLKQDLWGTTVAAHPVALRETTHMDAATRTEASAPEEGSATMALVAIMEVVVPHAECTCRMPAGYSGTTKLYYIRALWAESKKKLLWLLTKGLCLQAWKPFNYFSVVPELSV